ncbi:cobaltochelatase subunit CobN [Massilia sp. B-10]|nr:cobaltochelatase subunit CobN [Massilia sp. B-10]
MGELPASPEALLDRIMAHGVNLPEDRAALRELGGSVNNVTAADYARWFAALALRVQAEMTSGPLGRLHAEVLEAEAANERAVGRKRATAILKELHHLAEGADHPQRQAAIDGLRALDEGYQACLADQPKRGCAALAPLVRRVTGYGIEGMKGWGPAPGKIMVDSGKLLVPGLVFGNVFIGPQPPRGWEVDEELLHANTSVTPPHQYLAYYHWLRDRFKADVLVHVGRHSTYEFLPGKAVGLAADDYPSLIAADLPGVYPYIVDGVGEGTQAKRRGLAVMVDHLTPPLATTPLYDQLLTLRQAVESFESASSESLKAQAAQGMRDQVVALNLEGRTGSVDGRRAESARHRLRGGRRRLAGARSGPLPDQAAGKIHALRPARVRPPLEPRIAGPDARFDEKGGIDDPDISGKLADSPRLEMAGLLAGLDGRYIAPGKGNDPLRSPESLPTGRNFHAVDGDILPTRLGYGLADKLAAKGRRATARAKAAKGSSCGPRTRCATKA